MDSSSDKLTDQQILNSEYQGDPEPIGGSALLIEMHRKADFNPTSGRVATRPILTENFILKPGRMLLPSNNF